MDLYDEFCMTICRKIRAKLKDTYESVSYVRPTDLLEIYVRRGDLKFGYNIRNLSKQILYGCDTDKIVYDFIKEWRRKIYSEYFKD